jgi:hypothetical protein
MGLVGEIGSVLVGLGGLAFGWRERSRSLRHERAAPDIAAARDLLEEGAVHLHGVARVLEPLRNNLAGRVVETRAEIERHTSRHEELTERMRIRLQPAHEATREFESTGAALAEIYGALGAIELDDSAADEQRTRIATARDAFDDHRRRFSDAAARGPGSPGS